ncbi:MAG: hypothetical protein MMC23_001654 [Stictis urceolatum]|nr:hypothetical protein [Stictis urceolata]
MTSQVIRAVDRLPIAMASLSVGRATQHELELKIKAIAEAGFQGVEVFYEDIKIPVRRTSGSFDYNLLRSATHFRYLCDIHGLTITCLQPFKNYEGLLSAQRHTEKIEKLRVWLKIAAILRVDLIILPSMFHADPVVSTGNEAALVADLQELADIGATQSPPVRFAYEAMAWGPHVSCWQDCWRIVKNADRSNLGLCLDSFQILAKVWGDPTRPDGKLSGADNLFTSDCQELLTSVPLHKVFYVQIADAQHLDPPLSPSHPWYSAGQVPAMTWSRNARLFPFEEHLGSYLPVLELLKVWLVDLGYRGFLGFEVFNKSLFESGSDVPVRHAERGMKSWKKIVAALGLDNMVDEVFPAERRVLSSSVRDSPRL